MASLFKSLKRIGHAAVNAATLPKLRCADTDASAGPKLIDLVEEIHDIDACFKLVFATEIKGILYTDVHRPVSLEFLRVGEAGA